SEDLGDGIAWLKDEGWAYRFGDDGLWAAKDYDDSTWLTTNFDELVAGTRPPPAGEQRWDGAAWFRLRLEVDDRLANQPLALRVQHWGASEIYIDGRLVRRFGEIGTDRDVEENPRGQPVSFFFTEGGEHTIAIRYSYKAARDTSSGVGRWLMRGKFLPGFYAFIQPADRAAAGYARATREARGDGLFVGILAALALLHFLLFIFYRRERANLFYSIFAFCLAMTLPLNAAFNSDDPYGARDTLTAAVCFVLFVCAYAGAFSSLLAFLYVAFGVQFTKRLWLLLALWLVVIIVVAVYVREYVTLYVLCLVFVLTLAEAIRVMLRALVGRRDGAWIIMAGLLLFALAMSLLLGRELFDFRLPSGLRALNERLILLAVPISVSVFLARNFARTNRNLEAQLSNVKELSARQLEHERAGAELRLKHEQERAENERRAKELEEARQLQLSMLPRSLPQLTHLEIAAYMKPATEVGGDYYDFHLGDDGTLTVVVGDATGHGLKAGTVVTATKSLFNAFAHEPDIRTFFRESSSALKRMNLRGLFMGMLMVKINGECLRVCAAGMPSPLVYRAATNEVEEITLKGMPLGSIVSFPYQQQELKLNAGDVVLMMSDGFPERFDEAHEMIGDERARALLKEVAHESSDQIIKRFVSEGDAWAGARAQDDDVTFVVLKMIGAT
ncbi:MAG: SpoIIE family protein phosphatase, partial [Pyrinomonadaceae bacterium]|nr:SpoIIE family protein phosphatase [Pyrinomonadaceae bacterium]